MWLIQPPELPVFSDLQYLLCVGWVPIISFWKQAVCTVPSAWPLFLCLALWIVTIRFQQIRDLSCASRLNTAGLVLGFISSIGISILGNFQVQLMCVWRMTGRYLIICVLALKTWYSPSKIWCHFRAFVSVPNGTLHMLVRSCWLTMAAACTCLLSPWDRKVSHL